MVAACCRPQGSTLAHLAAAPQDASSVGGCQPREAAAQCTLDLASDAPADATLVDIGASATGEVIGSGLTLTGQLDRCVGQECIGSLLPGSRVKIAAVASAICPTCHALQPDAGQEQRLRVSSLQSGAGRPR